MFCIFPTITAGGCLGTFMGPVFATNTFPSAPGDERGEKRFKRGCLVGGPAVTGLGVSSSCPADQEDAGGAGSKRYLRSGALALWKRVASG